MLCCIAICIYESVYKCMLYLLITLQTCPLWRRDYLTIKLEYPLKKNLANVQLAKICYTDVNLTTTLFNVSFKTVTTTPFVYMLKLNLQNNH